MSKLALKDILYELQGVTDRAGKTVGQLSGSKLGRSQVVNRLKTELVIDKDELYDHLFTALALENPSIKRDLGPIVLKIVEKNVERLRPLAIKEASQYPDRVEYNPLPYGFSVTIIEDNLMRFDKIGSQFSKNLTKWIEQDIKKERLKTAGFDLGHDEDTASQFVFLGRLLSGRQGAKFETRRPGTTSEANVPIRTGPESQAGYVTGFGEDPLAERQQAIIDHLIPLFRSTAKGANATQEQIDRIEEIASEFNSKGDKNFVIKVRIEDKIANRAKKDDVRLTSALAKELKEYISKKDWANQESSDSKMRQISKTLVQQAIKRGAKYRGDSELLKPVSKGKNKVQSTRKIVTKVSKKELLVNPVVNKQKKRANNVKSNFNIVNIINARLHDVIRKNMGTPRLNYRTGRFATSVRAVAVVKTLNNFPSIAYTYMRTPYDVFDRTLGSPPWNTPERSPRSLIELSIREIAQGLGLGRFFLRRV